MDYPKSVPGVGLKNGKFTDGSPLTGEVASLDPAAHANAITDEILAVIAAAGLTPTEGINNQLLLALVAKFAQLSGATFNGSVSVPAATQSGHAVNLGQFQSSIATSGYQKLPSGLILQWGIATILGGATATPITMPIQFPHAGFSMTMTWVQASQVTSSPPIYMGGFASQSQFNAFTNQSVGSFGTFWIAIGW
ncbi:hypothetical protein [Jeongeupia sp. USM3]|uniref:gp53-like domain-containing protein n=1 Tax=Jeongeupia sp. USM3 TaxID=1906741 RepID=UPI0011AB3507|nr:hypothetical protein [Jeongeupia sp. USM3]